MADQSGIAFVTRGGIPIFDVPSPADMQAERDERQLKQQTIEVNRMKLSDYVADRNAKMAEAKAQQEEDAFLSDAVKRHTVNGKPDFDAVIADTYQWYPGRAMVLEKAISDHRSKLIAGRKQELEADEQEMKNDVATMTRMIDPDAFVTLRPRLSADAQQLVGDTYDPVYTPKRLAELTQAGAKNAQTTEQMRLALQNGDIRNHFLMALEHATTPEDVQDINEGLDEMYGPRQASIFRRSIGDPLTPEGKARIQAMRQSAPQSGGDVSWQEKTQMVNGKLTTVYFNPKTRQMVDGQGNDVSAQVKPVPPSSGGGGSTEVLPELSVDPNSQNILSQTGLSINAFRLLTGQGSQLPRDQATRNRAAKEAQEWARKNNVDIATLPSQYKTYNDVLSANISRLNNTKIMESELLGTIDNLKSVAKDADLGRLNFANVAKIWAGQQVNDSLAQQYALHLGQLRNELSAYYAATQGRTGNNITERDQRDAELVLRNGMAGGSLKGLQKAIENSTSKMGTVMQGSVERAQKQVWNLFGVGGNYNPTGGSGGGEVRVKFPDGVTYKFPNQKAADAALAAAKGG